MTTSKTLLGLLIVAAGLVFYLYQGQTKEIENDSLIESMSVSDSAINDLTRVVISQGEQQFDIRENGSDWTLNDGFYVRMDSLFKWVQALKNSRLIEAKTANPDNFPGLSLTDDDLRVRLYQDQQLVADIILGQASSTPGTRFIRYTDKQQTWLASELNELSSSEEIWQLSMIFDVPESQVQAIEWAAEDTLNLIKNSDTGQWQLAGKQAGSQSLDQEQIKTLAGSLSGFRIEQPIKSVSVSEQLQRTIIFGLVNGRKISLAVYGNKDNAIVKVTDSQQPERYQEWQFTVPDYKLSTLLIEPSAVFIPESDDAENTKTEEPKPNPEPAL